MLIGYLSDEDFAAIPDALVEIANPDVRKTTRTSVTGRIDMDLPPGAYRIWFAKPGYGSKSVDISLPVEKPHQFRLLSDMIRGYVWPKWVTAGDNAEFRVHSTEPYNLDLWRYGYKKEHVRAVGAFDEFGPRACAQIVPDGDFSQTGAQWNTVGYGNPIYQQNISAPDRSGLYYFHARGQSGQTYAFPWIVSPKTPTADMAVLASNITWNAYNSFGGRNNYVNSIKLPEKPTVNSRQDLDRYRISDHIDYLSEIYAPLSFDRPEMNNDLALNEDVTEPITGRYACGAAPAEWRVLGWLEREGFDYDYYAETQLDSGVLDLSRYKVLVISTHPEYWTRKMYLKVKNWVHEEGGRLVYLGGNGINCEVEIRDNGIVCLNGNERERVAAGTTDSRFDASFESEAHLLGVVYSHAGVMTGAPYKVMEPDHWVFEGTGVSRGDLFGEHALNTRCPGGASGHEQDKISRHSPSGTVVVAKGQNPDEGGAHMSVYETESGGAVFAAASITFGSCLLVDPVASTVTSNVLKKYLAQG